MDPAHRENQDACGTHHPDAGQRAEDVRKSTRVYLLVGLILFSGTLATAAVATIPAFDVGAHGFDKWDAILGLAIATTKASLVAAIFMHLRHERRWVYVVITLGALNAAGFFIGTYLHYVDVPNYIYFYENEHAPPVILMDPPSVAKVSEMK